MNCFSNSTLKQSSVLLIVEENRKYDEKFHYMPLYTNEYEKFCCETKMEKNTENFESI